MKWNRIAILFCIALTMLVGCASRKNEKSAYATEGPKENTPIEITVAHWEIDALMDEYAEKIKMMENELGIKLIFVETARDGYDQNVQMWAQTDNFPDVFVGRYRYRKQYRQWIGEGLIQEIPSDLSAYPYLSRHMQGKEAETCRAEDAAYCIFIEHFREPALVQLEQTVLYRADLAHMAGSDEEPTDWREFRKMVRSIRKTDTLHTGIQGLVVESDDMFGKLFLPYHNPLAAVEGNGFMWVSAESSGCEPAYFSGETPGENMLPVLSLIRLMYEEGTIAPDVAFLSGNQAVDNFLTGKAVALCVNGSYGAAIERFGDDWKEMNGGNFEQDVKALPVMPSRDGTINNLPVTAYASEFYIGSRVGEEKKERILAMFDWLIKESAGKSEISDSSYHPSDLFRLEQGRNADEILEEPLCRKLYMDMDEEFGIEVTDDLINIMTGSKPVDEMWKERIDQYREAGMDTVILKVNRAVKLYKMKKE